MFSGRIFSNTVNKSSEIPSLESFLDSNLSYEIRDIDSTLIEQAINVSVLHTQATYFYLKEHNEIILESGLNDFLNNAKEFFIKLKNVILDFVKKTVSYIQSYTGSFDKFLSENKNKLKEFDGEFEFENGYDYTFSDEIPNITIVYKMIDEFNNNITNPENITLDFLVDKRMEFLSEYNKDKIRSKIIKSKSIGVSSENYINEVRKTYRNKQENGKTLRIDKKYINNIVNDYGKLKAELKKVIKYRDEFIKSLDLIIDLFKRKVNITEEKITVNTITLNKTDARSSEVVLNNENDLAANINNYYQFEFKRFEFIYNCMYIAFFEKINAIKECLAQYVNVIRMALMTNRVNVITVSDEGDEI